MSQSVVDLPGLPPGVEVRRSTRRRRTVTAYREGGRTIVVVPQRMARADIGAYVEELVGRLEARERRSRRTDEQLAARAHQLSRRYLDGRAEPASVRWVSNQTKRWGSCTPADASIRLSDRLVGMPEHVVDYVLLHELAHLLVPGHGPDFEALLAPYPQLLEARAFLAGVDHALGHGLGDEVDRAGDGAGDGRGDEDEMPGGETGSEPGPVDAAAVRDGARTRVGSERARTRRRPRRRPVEGESTATLF